MFTLLSGPTDLLTMVNVRMASSTGTALRRGKMAKCLQVPFETESKNMVSLRFPTAESIEASFEMATCMARASRHGPMDLDLKVPGARICRWKEHDCLPTEASTVEVSRMVSITVMECSSFPLEKCTWESGIQATSMVEAYTRGPTARSTMACTRRARSTVMAQ